MERKKILYLSTRSLLLERIAEIQAAEEMNVDIILATPSSNQYNDYNIYHIINTSIGDYDYAEKMIMLDLKKNNIQIDGIVAWSDIGVELVARLATKMGLPSSSIEAAMNVRNKINTRKLLEELKTVNPKYAVFWDEESFLNALDEVSYPCIIKPAGASGGRGFFEIHEQGEALKTYATFRNFCDPAKDEIFKYFNEEFLIEEKLVGTEHSVAGMIADNNIAIFGIIDKRRDTAIPIEYESITPSLLPVEMQKELVNISRKAIRIVGLNWCGFHIDFIVTGDGPKIIEVGGRLGGECINSHLIPHSRPNLSPYTLNLKVVLGEIPFEKNNYVFDAKYNLGTRKILPPRPGIINSIRGLENVAEQPSVIEFELIKKTEDTVLLPKKKYNSFLVAYLIAKSELNINIRNLLDTLNESIEIDVR